MKTVNEGEEGKYPIRSLSAWIEDDVIVQKWYESLNVEQGTRNENKFGKCLSGTVSKGRTGWTR